MEYNYLNGEVKARNYDYIYDSEIDMDDYNPSTGIFAIHNRDNVLNITNGGAGANFIYLDRDSIILNDDLPGGFFNNFDISYIKTTADQSYTSHNLNTYSSEFKNFEALNSTTSDFRFLTGLRPKANDTIEIEELRGFTISTESFTPQSTSRVDIGEEKIANVIGTFDNYLRVDSVKAISLWMRNDGIPDDSINKLYLIHNKDGGLRGADNTYFLYSEYGDNYLNGELEVTGGIKQTQLTGSLTDGAPTDAQIDTITGTTPAAVGAGWQVTIKDNDGTGLLYRIESDGTNWFYTVMAQAS